MKRLALTLAFSLFLAGLAAPGAWAQEEEEPPIGQVPTDNSKRGQTGMKFVAMSVSARAAGIGNAMTAMETGSVAMFYNPASMANNEDFINVAVGQTQFAAEINYNIAAATIRPANGAFGTFGLSFMNVDYGTFIGTIRADNTAGYVDTENFSPTAMMIGFGYAKALSDRFAVGGNVKYATQDLTSSVMGFGEGGSAADQGSYIWQDNSEGAVAVDFGALYHTGFKSLNFAMSARNFSREVTYEDDNFELPLMLTIGVSMDMMDLVSSTSNLHSLMLSVDAMRPRDYYESLSVGAEYAFMDMFYLRGGYSFPTDEQGVSLGLGLNLDVAGVGLGADYAYTDFGILGNVNRLSLQFGL